MARNPTQREIFDALFAKHSPEIERAFLDAITDITDQAEIVRITNAIAAGNMETALAAMHIDPEAYLPVTEKITASYIDGGRSYVAALPPIPTPEGGGLVIRFDARNPRAETWIRNQSSDFITRTVADQKTSIRAALQSGLERGTNPRTTALDIVGRIDKATGRREGGIIGLSSPQERFVDTARQELVSGDPRQLKNYLKRTKRDRRFDKLVRDSIESGKPISKDVAGKMSGRYSDRLLKARGDTIARTETLSSLNASHDEALNQAVDTGEVRQQDVRRIWDARNDGVTRDSHRAIDGESRGIGEKFSNGLMHPGDMNGPIEEVANCRCILRSRIDFFGNLE